MRSRKPDVGKGRQWKKMIQEATRSGLSIREFCSQRHVKESQFYWWQRRLKEKRRPQGIARGVDNDKKASFALVSNATGVADAGIELVLQDGRRLRIGRGVDEQTLRAVLAAMESAAC